MVFGSLDAHPTHAIKHPNQYLCEGILPLPTRSATLFRRHPDMHERTRLNSSTRRHIRQRLTEPIGQSGHFMIESAAGAIYAGRGVEVM